MLPQSSYLPAKNRNNELAKGHSRGAGILATATGEVVTGRFSSKNQKRTHQESSSIFDAQNYTNLTRTGPSDDCNIDRKYHPALVLSKQMLWAGRSLVRAEYTLIAPK
tara:strand:+ start:303 stop:626 length:324 start_codon:yes stop_codon:yes gene_type:complete